MIHVKKVMNLVYEGEKELGEKEFEGLKNKSLHVEDKYFGGRIEGLYLLRVKGLDLGLGKRLKGRSTVVGGAVMVRGGRRSLRTFAEEMGGGVDTHGI